MSANIIIQAPDHFKALDNRLAFCMDNNFLPVLDAHAQPYIGMLHPATQFFCTATYRPEVWAQFKMIHLVPERKGVNLVPTALVFEGDKAPLEEQMANIRPEAFGHILSITYSGNRSLHVIVPIPKAIGEEIVDRELSDARAIFKGLWRVVGEQCFSDPTLLDDKCASIGRLSRLPGARRYPAIEGHIDLKADATGFPVQECRFLNGKCSPLDFKPLIDEVSADVEARAKERADNTVLYALQDLFNGFEDYGDALEHLRNSQAKWPSAHKALALQVLDGGDIPSESQLDSGLKYIGVVHLLNCRFPQLTEAFVSKVKAAHPSNLTRDISEYLPHADDGWEDVSEVEEED